MYVTPEIREATDADKVFIASSWHTSYWKLHAKERIDGVIYREEMKRYIFNALEKSRVLVAFFPAVPDEVLGYSVVDGTTLHWVYVKSLYRRSGIGSGLVPSGLLYYSHATDTVGKSFAKSVGVLFNPFRK